ncbi:MAG TPA: hypothetical protein VMG12_25630 [Polyangiaceae bacterium]|nr:hypothetical protein [Polyangiaceae bacterium]
MKTKTALVSVVGLLALAGCGADFDPGSNVSSLRVLSVEVDNPYAAPGETVRFDATSYDPDGRDIEWAWVACETPASGSVDGCLAEIAETAFSTGSIPLLANGVGQNSVELTIPANVLDGVPAEARPSVFSGVLSIACPGNLDLDLEAAAAADSLLPFRCTDSSGAELGLHDAIAGVKRVYIRETDRNQNPVIADITFDGEPWAENDIKEVDSCDTDDFTFDDCKGKGDHRIAANVSPESFEAGVDEFGRDFSEQLVVQHYATEGIFEYEARIAEEPQNRWVARSRASGQELRMWFVARDDRGGVALAERRVRVR